MTKALTPAEIEARYAQITNSIRGGSIGNISGLVEELCEQAKFCPEETERADKAEAKYADREAAINDAHWRASNYAEKADKEKEQRKAINRIVVNLEAELSTLKERVAEVLAMKPKDTVAGKIAGTNITLNKQENIGFNKCLKYIQTILQSTGPTKADQLYKLIMEDDDYYEEINEFGTLEKPPDQTAIDRKAKAKEIMEGK